MEIVKGIHQVDGVNANVYLLIDGEELTIVDTGMPNNAEKILSYVRKINWQPSSISKILLTHCHIDHAGSAYELKRITNAKVSVHQEDADFVSGKKSMPVPRGAMSIALKVVSPFFKFRPVEPDITLKENDKVGGLVVVHTPGHTPGSISLYDPVRRVLFVGDTVRFVDEKISGPPERGTLDMQQAIKSIEKISQLDFDVMLSGHGEPLKPKASDKDKEFCASLKRH
jgi:glyoxylase-like metal-dependent hydrolase (beta-lactamase superfamily II)